jgi:sigma-B regulation protein RsbU (phosphoserine phosphatase)
MLRAMFEELAPEAGDPGRLLTRLNQGLSGMLKEAGSLMFATAFYLVADVARGELRYAKAGHPNPLRFRRATGTVEPIRCAPGTAGPALGISENNSYQTGRETFAPGDWVLLFTDGLFEVVSPDNRDFDQEQLLELVRQKTSLPPPQLIENLLVEIERFTGTPDFSDDVCLLGMEFVRKTEGATT